MTPKIDRRAFLRGGAACTVAAPLSFGVAAWFDRWFNPKTRRFFDMGRGHPGSYPVLLARGSYQGPFSPFTVDGNMVRECAENFIGPIPVYDRDGYEPSTVVGWVTSVVVKNGDLYAECSIDGERLRGLCPTVLLNGRDNPEWARGASVLSVSNEPILPKLAPITLT